MRVPAQPQALPTTTRNGSYLGLRERISGEVILPDDSSYDAAREIWNRLHDRHPEVVIRCRTAEEVAIAIRYARERGTEVAIKGGGHHAAGYASTERGMLLDMSAMRAIEIDPVRRRAVAQSGMTWAHFDQVTQAFALAVTGPIVSMTGIAGFTLGGGFGWLHRKIGLGCDSLVSAGIVTANGDLVTASDAENPDLFWGLCGSGWNFGVVTSMEFRLHPIGPTVVAGLIYFPLDRFPELVAYYRDLVARFPDELTIWLFLRLAPPVPAIPKDWVGKPVVALVMCHCGAIEEGKNWAKALAQFDAPIANTVAEIEYQAWQKSLDPRWGNGFYNDWRGHYFDDLKPEAIRILMKSVERLTSPWTDIKIPHLGGAMSRISNEATAFGDRSARFALVIQARWERAADSTRELAWARELRDALTPHATGRIYTNFLAADEVDRIPSAHGSQAYRRLQALKAKYDPTNFFHANPNVPPAE